MKKLAMALVILMVFSVATSAMAELALLPQSTAMLEVNGDYAGWITIADTKLNNPFVAIVGYEDWQNPYLEMDFVKAASKHGTIYASSCSGLYEGGVLFTQGQPLILFGHHMKDGTMFKVLESYKKPSFAKKHNLINLTTLYEEKTFYVIAVYYFLDKDYNGDGQIDYQDSFGLYSMREHLNILRGDKRTYYFDEEMYEVLAGYPDDMWPFVLILQTCTYHIEGARLAVLAIEVE